MAHTSVGAPLLVFPVGIFRHQSRDSRDSRVHLSSAGIFGRLCAHRSPARLRRAHILALQVFDSVQLAFFALPLDRPDERGKPSPASLQVSASYQLTKMLCMNESISIHAVREPMHPVWSASTGISSSSHDN